MLRVSRPIDVVVLNCCVTATKVEGAEQEADRGPLFALAAGAGDSRSCWRRSGVARPGLFYRNLHRERLVRPARKCAVDLDLVRFDFCFEGVAVPVIDETFDIKGNVALCPLKDANRRGLPGPCGEGIASEWRIGARGAMEIGNGGLPLHSAVHPGRAERQVCLAFRPFAAPQSNR
jgi:hypothetical protein